MTVQANPQPKNFKYLPVAFFLVALLLIIVKLGLNSAMGNLTEFTVGAAFGSLTGAVLLPWLLWLVVRAIGGKEKAPIVQNFVLTGALILMPLMMLSDALKFMAQPPLAQQVKAQLAEGCHKGFDKYSQDAVQEAERNIFCSCYSDNYVNSLNDNDMKSLRKGQQSEQFLIERAIEAGSACNAAPLFAGATAKTLQHHLPMAIEEGVSMIDVKSSGTNLAYKYQVDGNITADQLGDEIRNSIIMESTKAYCDDPSLQVMLGYGVMVDVQYINANNEALFSHTIEDSNCS